MKPPKRGPFPNPTPGRRDGPIPPEDHPLMPWPIRLKLQEEKHQRLLKKLYQEHVKEDLPMLVKLRSLLVPALVLGAIYLILGHFGLLDEARAVLNSVLEFFRAAQDRIHF